jgi:hypothetical protein
LLAAFQACIDEGFPDNRGIAQPGSAAVLGTAGRWFESSCPDQTRSPMKIGCSRANSKEHPQVWRHYPGKQDIRDHNND